MNKKHLNIDRIIKKFTSGVKIKTIAEEENCCDTSVRKILKAANVYKTEMQKWTEEDKLFVLNNYGKLGTRKCANLVNKSIQSIATFAKNNKLRVDKETISKNILEKKKKYEINKDLFINISHPQEAYVLGLLWSDGCLRNGKNGDNSIRLVLRTPDAIDVKNIIYHSGNWSEKTWIHKQNKNEGTKYACCDKVFYNFLKDLDFLEKSWKSANKVLALIPMYLRHYWWRGYFDGDGYIAIDAKNITITSSYDQDWSFINFLNENMKPKIIKGKFLNKL